MSAGIEDDEDDFVSFTIQIDLTLEVETLYCYYYYYFTLFLLFLSKRTKYICIIYLYS